MKRLQILQKLVCEKFYVHEKIYVRKIAAVILSKIYWKRKESMKTKQPQFKWRLKNIKKELVSAEQETVKSYTRLY